MSPLFTPFTVKNLELGNRVVMAPMTRNQSPNNVPGKSVAEYYQRRAEGGAGLIITEGTCPGHKAASGYPDVPFLAGEAALAGWKNVVDAVHEVGGKIAPQIWHVGGIRRPGIEPGGDLPGYSPSGMAFPSKVTGHAMDAADIEETIAAYVQAAKDAKSIGFDAVEIHAAHGYLIDQFFWPATNQRDDEYGGSIENRTRFAVQIIERMREAVGPDFPIFLRYSQWKQQDYEAKLANNAKELERFLLPLAAAGVDVFHCSQRRYWEAEFEDSKLNLAGWTKKITGLPTVTVGSVGLDNDFIPAAGEKSFKDAEVAALDELERRLSDNEFDLVAVGRAMIANPNWANLVATGEAQALRAFDKSQLAQLY